MQIFLDMMERSWQRPAIHIVDEQHRRQQQDDRAAGRTSRIGRRLSILGMCNRDQVAALGGFM